MIKERYSVLYNRPLPELDLPNAKAYGVEDLKNLSRMLFAYVCKHHMQARVNYAPILKSLKSEGILPYVDHEVAYYAPEKCKYMVIVYERPMGGKVMNSLTDRMPPAKEGDITNKIIPAIIEAIGDLATRGIAHRAIRMDNLFYMDKERTHLVLGDFMTAPPAYDQPLIFETIESCMCIKEGRGEGNVSNDLYSFAVCCLFFILGRHPLPNLGDLELLESKVKKGSYATLIKEEKIFISLVEIMRGLLADSMEQRWNIGSVDAWMKGRRLNPIQAKAVKNSQRALSFNGTEYHNARELAMAFSRNWQQAAMFMDNDKLDIFLRRGLEDNVTADEINKMVSEVKFKYPVKNIQEEIWVARVCMILDPKAPIRYKGVNFFLDGLGCVVAAGCLGKIDIKIINEILARDVINKSPMIVNEGINAAKYKTLVNYMAKYRLGSGVERCLYELNPFIPCLSPFLISEYVDDISQVVAALDRVAKKADQKKWPVDKHIAAYIACNYTVKTIDQIEALNNTDMAVSTSGMVNILALLQWDFGPEKAYNLCSWIGGLVIPIIDSYYDRERRAHLENALLNYVRKGSLPDLYAMLDNAKERDMDYTLFAKAKKRYATISKEINIIEREDNSRQREYLVLGSQVSALISVTVGIMFMLVLLIVKLF